MREASVDHQFSIPNPKLWSPDSPSLYTAVTEVKVAGKVVDRYETVFGLRSFRWDSATGFYLNDKPLKIKGVCLHHDLGCAGAVGIHCGYRAPATDHEGDGCERDPYQP